MRQQSSDYGTILVGSSEDVFTSATEILLTEASKRSLATIALPGGSTPQRWFRWMLEREALPREACTRILWTTSDERYVPPESAESNFGNAARLLLDPLHVPDNCRLPWPTHVDPHSASIVFNRRWNERFGAHRCFDLCLLGMGDDGHTASLFPGGPLLGMGMSDNFASVDVPGKGWRFTISPAGLSHCGRIVVLVTGTSKAARLRSVLRGEHVPTQQPIQILRDLAPQVTWLLDEDAAAALP